MPITKSAKKAAKQAIKRRTVNVEFKDLMKSAVKAVKKAVQSKADDVAQLVVYAQKRIDKASKRNIITKESASRKKSTLMRMMNDEGASLATVEKKTIAKAPKTTTKAPAKKAAAKKTTAKKPTTKKTA